MADISVVPRQVWCNIPSSAAQTVTGPVDTVILSLQDSFKPCHNEEECVKRIQEIYMHYYQEKFYINIPFNFIIGNDGNVYEGGGWHERPFKSYKNPEEFSNKTIDIAILGSMAGEKIGNASVSLAEDFVEANIKNGHISEDHCVKTYLGEKLLF